MKRTTKPVKRAILEVMQSVPPGCIAHPVPDEDTAPHLHCGEFAVIDTRDRDPIIGEIYVIERNVLNPVSNSDWCGPGQATTYCGSVCVW